MISGGSCKSASINTTVRYRDLMAEISGEIDHFHVGVGFAEFPDDIRRAIAAAVVHENELVRFT
mgnify:CR=1 FL=1